MEVYLNLLLLAASFVGVVVQPIFEKDNKQNYIIEILDCKTTTEQNDYLDVNIKTVRISRGINGLSGYIDVKKDVLDDFFYESFLTYSTNGNTASFAKTPFHIRQMSIVKTINDYYNDYIDAYHPCLTNAPVFDDLFKLPFEKRRIELNKCTITAERLPSYMRPGYYKLNIILNGELFEVKTEALFKIVIEN